MTHVDIESESVLTKHCDFCIGTFVASYSYHVTKSRYTCKRNI